MSRSYYGRLIPTDRAGEFFGFYNMMGKFAAVLGPLLMGFDRAAHGQFAYGDFVGRAVVRGRRHRVGDCRQGRACRYACNWFTRILQVG